MCSDTQSKRQLNVSDMQIAFTFDQNSLSFFYRPYSHIPCLYQSCNSDTEYHHLRKTWFGLKEELFIALSVLSSPQLQVTSWSVYVQHVVDNIRDTDFDAELSSNEVFSIRGLAEERSCIVFSSYRSSQFTKIRVDAWSFIVVLEDGMEMNKVQRTFHV